MEILFSSTLELSEPKLMKLNNTTNLKTQRDDGSDNQQHRKPEQLG